MKRLLGRFLPLPISAYLIGFFSLSLLLFAVVGGWMLVQMDRVTSAAEQSRQNSADAEVMQAVERVLSRTETILKQLSQWDEARQQLHDPTYYEYWHNTRALQTQRTPPYVTDVDIYNEKGRIVQSHSSNGLPETVPANRHYLHIDKTGNPSLVEYAPITTEGDKQSPIGYVGIRVDFNQALAALNRLIYTDSKSLSFISPANSQIPTSAILKNLSYMPYDTGETAELEAVMFYTLSGFALMAALLIPVSYFLTSYLLHSPLRGLANYLEALRRGHGDISKAEIRGATLCVREFDVLRNSIINYQYELEEMHSHLDQKNKELWRMAHHDSLTGVANRRAYDEDWARLQQLIRGQRIDVSVMLIDCDHFKAINDTYGHDVGDEVINLIAETLKQSLREGDHLYRLGGDEFAVHLLNTDTEQSRILAQRCQDGLRQQDFRKLGIREPIRISIGIATATGTDERDLAQLHKKADIAMYQAKRPGSNKIAVYHDDMAGNGDTLLSNRYITAVYRAIEEDAGIELHYQPVIHCNKEAQHDGFYETLVRLRDERGIIMPINIFPVVESEGLSVEFDYAIIRSVAHALEKEDIPAHTCISINIDGSTLMHQEFIQRVSQLKPFISPGVRCIVLEITENALISELEEGSRKLRHLREAGFTIALDDFGSGYSSLRYLARMPVDIIKLDIGMVRDLEGDQGQRTITEHIAHMVRSAGYQLVAEGIESEQLLERITELGFTHAQGFLFDRPLPLIDPERQLTVSAYPRNTPLGPRLVENR